MLPARCVWRRRPLFAGDTEGCCQLLCARRSCGRGRSTGAREQPVLKKTTKTNILVLIAVKRHLGIVIITITTM